MSLSISGVILMFMWLGNCMLCVVLLIRLIIGCSLLNVLIIFLIVLCENCSMMLCDGMCLLLVSLLI